MPRRSVRRSLVQLRRIWRDIVFRGCVFVSLALFAVALSSSPGHRKNDQWQGTTPKENAESEPYKSLWERTLDDPVAFLTLVLDVFTGILAIFTIGLWDTTRRGLISQSKETRRAVSVSNRSAAAAEVANAQTVRLFTIERRPWLAFDHHGPSSVKLHFNMISVEIPFTLKNYGSSPALFVNCRAVRFETFDLLNIYEFINNAAERVIKAGLRQTLDTISIFPGEGENVIRRIGIEFTREEIDKEFISGVYGYVIAITYRNPISDETYCSISGYNMIFNKVRTYSMTAIEIDRTLLSVHELPGARRYF